MALQWKFAVKPTNIKKHGVDKPQQTLDRPSRINWLAERRRETDREETKYKYR